jgi:mRNA-degrading endonuclease toxin of MazEF toxin-antitoxin module
MQLERGHVVAARFPHASGARGKKRPVVVVQCNVLNKRLRHAVVVQLTTNLDDRNDPACFVIEAATPEGRAAGIQQDSLFCGYLISLMSEDRLTEIVGKLSDDVLRKADGCLRAALGLD